MTVDTEPEAPAATGPAERFARVPALDGVRALAIAAVLLYHNYAVEGNSPWGGGFLGVDVFFVLSGFLITTLLLRERDRSGRVDFAHFWERRARRLLPALFVLIGMEAIVAQRVLNPLQASVIRSDAIGTLFYYENWRLAFHSPTIASHTWSLAVEEQWYLFWPLLLIGLLWFARGRHRSVRWIVAGLAIASAVECALLFHGDGSRSYFGTDTRAQPLLIGAWLALLLVHRPQYRSRLVQVGGWCGLAFLVWIFLTLRGPASWVYRGGFLAVAVAAALVVAAVMQSEDTLLAKMFSFKPFVAIGIISYGLYLYHLPIYLWLTPTNTGLNGWQLPALRISITVAIAVASYHLIEKRFMRRRGTARPPLVLIFAGAVTALLVIVIATPGTGPAPVDDITYALQSEAAHTPKGVPRVMVVGDSPVIALATATPGAFHGKAIRGAPYAMNHCDVVPGTVIDEQGTQHDQPEKCVRLPHNIRQLMLAFRPRYGVLMLGPTDARNRVAESGLVQSGSDESIVSAAIDRTRQAVTAAGAQLVLLPVLCDTSSPVPGARIDWLNGVLADYAKNHTGVIFERQALASCGGGATQQPWTWPQLQQMLTSR
jgi:peptidoglycan/LPS O-acetylase OafA/YrhL